MNNTPMREGIFLASITALLASTALVPTTMRAAQPASSSSIVYSARAVAMKIDGVTNPASGQIVIADTGALSPTGGALEVSQSNVNLDGGALTIDDANAQATGLGPEASAESTLGGYHVHFVTHD